VLLVCNQDSNEHQHEDKSLNRLLVVIPVLALSACAAQPKEGSDSIRVVGDNHECEIIASVYGEGAWGSNKARADEGAVIQVKNRAAAAGANAIYFEDTHSKVWGSMVLAKALHCDQGQFERMSRT